LTHVGYTYVISTFLLCRKKKKEAREEKKEEEERVGFLLNIKRTRRKRRVLNGINREIVVGRHRHDDAVISISFAFFPSLSPSLSFS